MAEPRTVKLDCNSEPPEEGQRSWWVEVARRVGRASRALADGAEGFAAAFHSNSEAVQPTVATDTAALEDALSQLCDHMEQFGRDRLAELAADKKFWELLGRVERLHSQAPLRRQRAPKSARQTAVSRPSAKPPSSAADDFLGNALSNSGRGGDKHESECNQKHEEDSSGEARSPNPREGAESC